MSVMTEDTEASDEAPTEPFHIVCDDSGDSVRWVGVCLNDNEAIMQHLREQDALDPYLLVVATQNGVEVARKFAPLSDGMVHLAFRRAGTFRLQAAIVYEDKSDRRRLRRLFDYTTSSGVHACNVVDMDGDLHNSFWATCGRNDEEISAQRHPFVATASISVNADNFANERAEWRTKLVGVFFRDNGRNECNWRKRWLGSLALCVTWLPLQYLIKFFGLILYSLGGFVYDMNFKSLPKPGRHGAVLDMFGEVDKHTAWWFKEDKSRGFTDYKERNIFWIMMTIIVPFWVIASLLLSLNDDLNLLHAALICAGSIVGIIVVIALVVGIIALARYISDSLSSAEHKAKKRAKRQAREMARIERLKKKDLDHQLRTLSCTASGQPMTVSRLINRRRTAPSVVWNQTKDKVCRPFQQG